MLFAIFYWTGVAVWGCVGCSIGLCLYLITRNAVVAVFYVIKVYRAGPFEAAQHWAAPFRMWLYLFLDYPKFVVRRDLGGRIYRPGVKAEPEPERYPG